MNTELDEALCRDFPEIFKNRYADIRTTAMCWGFECGDGWEPLIRMTCNRIMSLVISTREDIIEVKGRLSEPETNKSQRSDLTRKYYTPEKLAELETTLVTLEKEIPAASQIKEKFGGLRFYIHGGTEKHHNIIEASEAMSYYVCEVCGTMSTAMLRSDGWYSTLCDKHAAERGKENVTLDC